MDSFYEMFIFVGSLYLWLLHCEMEINIEHNRLNVDNKEEKKTNLLWYVFIFHESRHSHHKYAHHKYYSRRAYVGHKNLLMACI